MGGPFTLGAGCMRTSENLVTQLIMVWGHGVFFNAEDSGDYAEHSGDGAKPDMSHQKQLQGQKDHIDLV